MGFAGLLVVRRRWAARALQAALLLGALEWLRTIAGLVEARAGAGQPWTRMAIILGSVAAVCAASALAFLAPRVRRWYGNEAAAPPAPAPE